MGHVCINTMYINDHQGRHLISIVMDMLLIKYILHWLLCKFLSAA